MTSRRTTMDSDAVEVIHQARLAREARDVLLGTITVGPGLDEVVNVAKVEVTYGHGDTWTGDYDEHSGYFIVRMTGELDPWVTAHDVVHKALADRYPDATYTSVDDISAI
jgi:hypothetical protein